MRTLDVVIYGTGGAAKGYHWHLTHKDALIKDRNGNWCTPRVIGHLDDDADQHGKVLHGVPVLGGLEWCRANSGTGVFVGIGAPDIRKRLVHKLEKLNVWFPTFVSPDARVAMGSTLGEGCFVYSGCVINVDAHLERHCFLNMNVTIGHDAVLGEFTVVFPGAAVSGQTVIGNRVEVGANSTILQGQAVGDKAIIGAMACVTKDIPARATAVGIPARVIRFSR